MPPMRGQACIALTLALPLLSACDLVGVRGSGDLMTESRNVGGFTEIALQSRGSVTVEVTGSESLTIEAEENLLPLLTSEVEDGRLVLGTTEPISPTREIVYTVTVAELQGLSIGGSGEVTAGGVEAVTFEVDIGGSGEVFLSEISVEELVIQIGGSGDVEVSGKAEHLDLAIGGSGSYRGEDMVTTTAVVDVGGSGDAVVNVTEHLEASVGGSGSIEYLGDPAVDSSISGSGVVEQR